MSCRCHRSNVSGVAIVGMSCRARRPTRYTRAADRRRPSSFRRTRLVQLARRHRFSWMKYLTTCRSRRASQPVKTISSSWKGKVSITGRSLYHVPGWKASAEKWNTTPFSAATSDRNRNGAWVATRTESLLASEHPACDRHTAFIQRGLTLLLLGPRAGHWLPVCCGHPSWRVHTRVVPPRIRRCKMRRVRDLWAPIIVLIAFVGREGHGLAGPQQVSQAMLMSVLRWEAGYWVAKSDEETI